jgi:drug/metabolite transporter (DMT)-like permease
MKTQTKAYWLALLVVFLWSGAASAFKLSLKYFTFIELLFYSTFFASCALFIIVCKQKKFKIIGRYQRSDFLFALMLGFLNPFLYYLVLFKAYSLLPGQIAQPLNFIWPIMIVFLSAPILKQKIKLQSLLAIMISFAGVIIISSRGKFTGFHFEQPWGVFLALLSSLIWALFFVLRTADKRDTESQLFVGFLAGLLFVLPFFLFSFRLPSLYGLLGALYIGLFEMSLAFVFWIKALKLSRTTALVSNLVYLTPFIALILLSILVGEKILMSTIIGLLLIVLGIVYQRWTEKADENH